MCSNNTALMNVMRLCNRRKIQEDIYTLQSRKSPRDYA